MITLKNLVQKNISPPPIFKKAHTYAILPPLFQYLLDPRRKINFTFLLKKREPSNYGFAS